MRGFRVLTFWVITVLALCGDSATASHVAAPKKHADLQALTRGLVQAGAPGVLVYVRTPSGVRSAFSSPWMLAAHQRTNSSKRSRRSPKAGFDIRRHLRGSSRASRRSHPYASKSPPRAYVVWRDVGCVSESSRPCALTVRHAAQVSRVSVGSIPLRSRSVPPPTVLTNGLTNRLANARPERNKRLR